ncbi:unnamed protein product [Parnassius mnemosyne]|uniref:Uncharacterized protein n=1 Tax=Parnassius mnemosyne TaxID=213953 RepID=A0AAV1LUH5_9NEOP
MFYVHRPYRRFGAPSFRGLKVAAVKKAHESELNQSVLVNLTRPSDAFEVFKSYSVAHRSRRTTLARLAEKYGNSLYVMYKEFQCQCSNGNTFSVKNEVYLLRIVKYNPLTDRRMDGQTAEA